MGSRTDNKADFVERAESYIMMARAVHAQTGASIRHYLQMADMELVIEVARRVTGNHPDQTCERPAGLLPAALPDSNSDQRGNDHGSNEKPGTHFHFEGQAEHR